MEYAKLIDGNLQYVKMPLRIDENDVFTNDENILRAQGYKPITYTEPETREGFYASGFNWVETYTEIVQEWQYSEITESETTA